MLPILYQSPEFVLYSYPLLMGIGWGVAYQVFLHFFTGPSVRAQFLFWGSFLSAWIGAKILYLLTSEQDLAGTVSFWTGGGFVFYGGLIAVAVFLFVLGQLGRIKLAELWAMLPALTLGHAIGRFGCLLAGCCYGSETRLWWSIHLHGADRHPTQLLEALGLLLLTMAMVRLRGNVRASVGTYCIGYGLLRLGIEGLRGDLIRGSWAGLTPSQWISLSLLILGFSLIQNVKSKT